MYTGPWVKAPKPHRPGTMHDDEVAKSRGFQGALVGNATVAALATPAVVASLGQDWFVNGAHKASFAKPTYGDDEIRVAWEEVAPDPGDRKKITFVVEKRNGDKAVFGWAAVGEPGGPRVTPPWEREPVPPLKPEDDLMPQAVVGSTGPKFECSMAREFLGNHLDTAGDGNWWYRVTSPWGGPVIPPPEVGAMVLAGQRQQARGEPRSPLWKALVAGGRELVVQAPLFCDQTYRAWSQLVAKGRARSSFYTITEFTIEDAEGKTLAVMRSRVNYFTDALVPSGRA